MSSKVTTAIVLFKKRKKKSRKGGNAISFIKEYEKVDFKESLEIGAKKLNVDFAWKAKSNFNRDAYLKHQK